MKLAICGIFYDGYYDLWEDFLELFYSNWPECPYELYIVNNIKELEYDKEYAVKVLHAGEDAEYSRKVQYAVDNIDADYYLLLLDDFFLSKRLDKNLLTNILEYIVKENIKYLALPLDEFKDSYNGKKIKSDVNLRVINPKAEYTVSCQPAIWKRDFLKQCIGKENYNAWVFEGVYSKAPWVHSEEFLNGCCVNKDNILALKHGALQGKMVPTTIDFYNSINYEMHNNREVLPMKIYRKHLRKAFLKRLVPLSIQRFIKKHFKTHSVVEKYNNEIQKVIKSLEA